MAALAPITINGLADKTGVDIESIRTYERLGFIPKPRRAPGGHALYRGEDVEILTFVTRALALGFTAEAIGQLLTLSDSRQKRPCKQVHDVATKQLEAIRTKLAELTRMERALSELTDRCAQQSNDATRCPLLASLSEPH